MNIHYLQGYIQSIYLVEYQDKLMLLDGCCRADIPLVTTFVTETLNRPLTDIDIVVVTHMHPDHSGGAHRLRALSGCRIVSSKHKHHWYGGWDGWLMYVTDLALARWVAKRQGKKSAPLCFWPWLAPDIRLCDGDIIPDFDEWQILETPGHTDRDLSVRHIPSNRIYVADLLVTVKGRYIPPFPVFYPEKYRNSLEKIFHYQPAALWLAHAGEIQLSDEDKSYLKKQLPSRPITHWLAVTHKLKQTFRLMINRNKKNSSRSK